MLKSCILTVSLIFAATASAQIYEWKDPLGGVNYSDQPPPGAAAKLIREKSVRPVSDQGAMPPVSERLKALQDQRTNTQKEKDTEAQKLAQAEELDRSCEQARNQLKALQSGQRLSRFNAEGEPEPLDEAARQSESARAQGFIAERCK